ncbi:TetR/AcrR family transcriptional regulator [Cohnella ginsengisoli]|uniref:TetR/AcrR family transcriptional regulator n=1 Tax=Cohnella ginsengisoli TaxID=425004 RepID=A0A9X4KJ24_9BACL|nr:TetR/AcrR family transcriptional regulator [Cohnella ginsengisoli]MDG0793154.1 TetR/AcrR family transcriptional regulator [Cohnella ginsengisoli]
MKQQQTRRAPGRPKGNTDSRDLLLSTASALFMEFGYEPVSLNQIAERAGVTKASIYYYFSGKSELFAASVTEMMGRIRGFTRQILEQEGTLRERLIRVATVKMANTHVEFESMMREAIASLSEEQRRGIREAEHRIHEVLAACFADAAARGEMRGGEDPLLLAHAFSSLLMVAGRDTDGERREDLPVRIVDLFWQGAGPRA